MGSDAERDGPGEATRGMHGQAAPFILEATLHARRLQNGISIALGERRDGDTVMSGDRMQLSIRTSEDAYLYLAFCSQLAVDPLYHGLTVFPPQGSIRVKANEITTAPDKAAEILLDDKPGQEALYLIFSHVELSSADPRLAAAITAARQAGKAADCGERFQAKLVGPKGKHEARPRGGGDRPSAGLGSPAGPDRNDPMPRGAPSEVGKPRVVLERGADIVWNGGFGVNGDETGIAILRYGLTHVATK